MLLKVAIEDDLGEVADRYLRPNNIFRRADGFSRIGIAVAYNRVGDEKERTLNFRKEPDKDAAVIRGLKKGEKLVLIEEQSGWYRVKTSKGTEGWITASPSYSKVE